MTKKRLLIIGSILVAITILLGILAPQKIAEKYKTNVLAHINSYLEDKKARQPQIDAIIQKGTSTSAEEDQKLHNLIKAEIEAAANLPNIDYNLPLQPLLSWHPAYQEPLRIQRNLQNLATETKDAYQTSDTINTYLEERISINKRISANPLDTAEQRQQMMTDYKSMVETNSKNDLLQRPDTKEAVTAKLAVDKRYLELWSQYPAMYDRADNNAIDELNTNILANDQEKNKANELVDKMTAKNNEAIKTTHEKIKKLRDSI